MAVDGGKVIVSGRTVRRRREDAGLSAIELARRARVSRSYLSEIETGRKRDVSPPVCARLAGALGCAVVDLRAE